MLAHIRSNMRCLLHNSLFWKRAASRNCGIGRVVLFFGDWLCLRLRICLGHHELNMTLDLLLSLSLQLSMWQHRWRSLLLWLLLLLLSLRLPI